MGVKADREHARIGVEFALQHRERRFQPLRQLVGGLPLHSPHGHIVDLPRIGQAQEWTFCCRHPARQVIEQPIVRELDAAALENLRRPGCLATAGAEPAAHALAR